jgi:phosphoserine aminotransferase
VIIVRDDLLGRARADTPSVLDYAAMAKDGSMLNTPPTYTWYIAGLVFQWLERQGGLAAIGEANRAKAAAMYAAIDASPFYSNPVAKDARSWMNVVFTLAAGGQTFLAGPKVAGLVTLRPRSVAECAPVYNAMPMEACVVELHGRLRRRNACPQFSIRTINNISRGISSSR